MTAREAWNACRRPPVGALVIATGLAVVGRARAEAPPPWDSTNDHRILVQVETAGRRVSHAPVSIEFDFQRWLSEKGIAGTFDEHTIEVRPVKSSTAPGGGGNPQRCPHRVDKLFGSTLVTLHFALPDDSATRYAIYFDTDESGRGDPRRYGGIVGDGDRFCEDFGRREIACSHFDCLVDFDSDGDLDLFLGGVEPFVHCYENRGGNRLVDRGRLSSGGKLFSLPRSRSNRSWVTVAFHDIDGDGDHDFFPSFGDGPDAGRIIFYENVTRESGQLTFTRIGPLETVLGTPLAGGDQAGGWFPSIAFVGDWDSDGIKSDVMVGSRNRCWLYRRLASSPKDPPQFAAAEAVRAGAGEIELVNPRFDAADIDADGDIDLLAGTQPGPVHVFENVGSATKPRLAGGRIVASAGRFLIGDAHSGIKVADFDGDKLPDLVSGRFWQRTDLDAPDVPRDFGGFFRNTGTARKPAFQRTSAGAPFTEQVQICDAVRQNCVRAVDWNADGRPDLLAGDTDGFIWLFINESSSDFMPLKSAGRLRAAGKILSVTPDGGHARFDVCDWDGDRRHDLVVADGHGSLTLFLNRGSESQPDFIAGQKVCANDKPLQIGGRASAIVCDWNNDGRDDVVLADDKGYYFSARVGERNAPAAASPRPILFGGKAVRYVRPNLGSFVDWDGDGKRDLIGCHFENSIRFYRNVGSGAAGAEPEFENPEGVMIVEGESPQMISGAHAIDWNGDGDIDLLTGQGHGGSGLRFYERDWIENERGDSHPAAQVVAAEVRPAGS